MQNLQQKTKQELHELMETVVTSMADRKVINEAVIEIQNELARRDPQLKEDMLFATHGEIKGSEL